MQLNTWLAPFKRAHYSNVGIPGTHLDYWEMYLVPPGCNHTIYGLLAPLQVNRGGDVRGIMKTHLYVNNEAGIETEALNAQQTRTVFVALLPLSFSKAQTDFSVVVAFKRNWLAPIPALRNNEVKNKASCTGGAPALGLFFPAGFAMGPINVGCAHTCTYQSHTLHTHKHTHTHTQTHTHYIQLEV